MRNQLPMSYRGWKITFDSNRPVTGLWRAEKAGVGVCHNSYEAVKHLVDAHEIGKK